MSCKYIIQCDECGRKLGRSNIGEAIARRRIVDGGHGVITYTGDYCTGHVPADQDPRQIMQPREDDEL